MSIPPSALVNPFSTVSEYSSPGLPKGYVVGRETAIAYAKAGAAAVCLGARPNLSQVEQDVQEAAVAAGKNPPKLLTLNLDVSNRQTVETATAAVGQCCDF